MRYFIEEIQVRRIVVYLIEKNNGLINQYISIEAADLFRRCMISNRELVNLFKILVVLKIVGYKVASPPNIIVYEERIRDIIRDQIGCSYEDYAAQAFLCE